MQIVARRARRRTVLAAPAAALLAALALSGPASAAHAPTQPGKSPGAGAQGLIMKDGNICDPIRHMGC
jgi:hypothetical protein